MQLGAHFFRRPVSQQQGDDRKGAFSSIFENHPVEIFTTLPSFTLGTIHKCRAWSFASNAVRSLASTRCVGTVLLPAMNAHLLYLILPNQQSNLANWVVRLNAFGPIDRTPRIGTNTGSQKRAFFDFLPESSLFVLAALLEPPPGWVENERMCVRKTTPTTPTIKHRRQ